MPSSPEEFLGRGQGGGLPGTGCALHHEQVPGPGECCDRHPLRGVEGDRGAGVQFRVVTTGVSEEPDESDDPILDPDDLW